MSESSSDRHIVVDGRVWTLYPNAMDNLWIAKNKELSLITTPAPFEEVEQAILESMRNAPEAKENNGTVVGALANTCGPRLLHPGPFR